MCERGFTWTRIRCHCIAHTLRFTLLYNRSVVFCQRVAQSLYYHLQTWNSFSEFDRSTVSCNYILGAFFPFCIRDFPMSQRFSRTHYYRVSHKSANKFITTRCRITFLSWYEFVRGLMQHPVGYLVMLFRSCRDSSCLSSSIPYFPFSKSRCWGKRALKRSTHYRHDFGLSSNTTLTLIPVSSLTVWYFFEFKATHFHAGHKV